MGRRNVANSSFYSAYFFDRAVADTVKHSHASLEIMEVIRQIDGFTHSQVHIQHMDIMVGGDSYEFIVTVETSTAIIHNLLSSPEEESEFVEMTIGDKPVNFLRSTS